MDRGINIFQSIILGVKFEGLKNAHIIPKYVPEHGATTFGEHINIKTEQYSF
jgi:hypothetical protein